jgi:hypothetical protein
MSTSIRRPVPTRHHLRSFLVPVLAITASLGLAACGGSNASTTSTTAHKLPPVPAGSDVSPSVTVESYLSALSHHDIGLAKKLVYPKVRKGIMSAAGSGFTDLTNLQDVKVLATATGAQYRPTESGVSFSKYGEFAQVTVSYSATFSSSKQPSGPQRKLMTVGENSGSKWVILAIKSPT